MGDREGTGRDSVRCRFAPAWENAMSIVDKVVAAVAPPESDEERAEATRKAWQAAQDGDWLSVALDHHDMIREAFAAVRDADDEASQRDAQEELKLVLMGHSIAEEGVLYPALALSGEKAHAEMGFNEQAMVKIQMMALANLAPLSREYMDKLEHIEGAVLHHMYQEESTWFLELKEKGANQEQLRDLFVEEFERYTDIEIEIVGTD
jgi:hypothetical protein